MIRSRLSLMLVVLLLSGVLVAVGAGTALGQTSDPSTVTLSTPDMTPPAGATVIITATVHVGDDVANPSDPFGYVDLTASLGTNAQGTLGLMAGAPYPGESCVNDPNPTGTAYTACEWYHSTSDAVFTFPVTIAPDTSGVDVYAELQPGETDGPLAQDLIYLAVMQEETTTTTTTTSTTMPAATTSSTVAPTSIVSTTVAATTTIAEVETDIVDGDSTGVAMLVLAAMGFLTLSAVAVRARRFDR